MKGLFHHTIHLSANVELKGDITILCLYDDLVVARTYGVVAFISWAIIVYFPHILHGDSTPKFQKP